MLSKILIFFINLYQQTLSPDHGLLRYFFPNGYCQYYPSCSQYAKEALQHKGLKGIPKAVYRVLRCNPWSAGGIDLIHR